MQGLIWAGEDPKTGWAVEAYRQAHALAVHTTMPLVRDARSDADVSVLVRAHATGWTHAMVVRDGLVWQRSPAETVAMVELALLAYAGTFDALFSGSPHESEVAFTIVHVPSVLGTGKEFRQPRVKCFDPPVAVVNRTARVPWAVS